MRNVVAVVVAASSLWLAACSSVKSVPRVANTPPPPGDAAPPSLKTPPPPPPVVEPSSTPAPAVPPIIRPPADPPKDPEVMAFAFQPGSTSDKDGGIQGDIQGPGSTQLRISWDALESRNEEITNASMMTSAFMATITRFYDTGGADAQIVREKLTSMSGAPLDEARASYLAAVEREAKRLFYVERAVAAATEAKQPLAGVSPPLIRLRIEAIRTGQAEAAVDQRIGGYRNLAQGLVAYIDGDALTALEKMKGAARAIPDLAVTYAFLGSLYYLFQQPDSATVAWKRALELDPTNDTVKNALRQYGRKGR